MVGPQKDSARLLAVGNRVGLPFEAVKECKASVEGECAAEPFGGLTSLINNEWTGAMASHSVAKAKEVVRERAASTSQREGV